MRYGIMLNILKVIPAAEGAVIYISVYRFLSTLQYAIRNSEVNLKSEKGLGLLHRKFC